MSRYKRNFQQTLGTCSNICNWKTGRQMQLFSQKELNVFLLLNWRDDVVDIQEHVEMDADKLRQLSSIAAQKFQKHIAPPNRKYINFLMTHKDRTQTAVMIVNDKMTMSAKTVEQLWLIKRFWNERNVKFELIDNSDINKTLANNIRLVTEFYQKENVYDKSSAVKYLIANKIIPADLETQRLDIRTYMDLLNRNEDKLCKIALI